MYKKVHIIDDDEISIFLTEAMLDVANFAREYAGFACAKLALQELLNTLKNEDYDNLPDVIFLDLNMPLLSGWDLLNALQTYEAAIYSRCQIYILTSSVSETDIKKAKAYSMVTGFLQKPLEEHAVANIAKPM